MSPRPSTQQPWARLMLPRQLKGAPLVSRRLARCPTLTVHSRAGRWTGAAWPSPRARPGLRVTLPTRLPSGKWTWGCNWKDHPRASASSSRLTVPGQGARGRTGAGSPTAPLWPPSPSRQTVLGQTEAAVCPERSATSWGLGRVQWGPAAPRSLGAHQCARRPCFPDKLSLTVVFPADPSQ